MTGRRLAALLAAACSGLFAVLGCNDILGIKVLEDPAPSDGSASDVLFAEGADDDAASDANGADSSLGDEDSGSNPESPIEGMDSTVHDGDSAADSCVANLGCYPSSCTVGTTSCEGDAGCVGVTNAANGSTGNPPCGTGQVCFGGSCTAEEPLTVTFRAIGPGNDVAAISSSPPGINCSSAGGPCTSSSSFPSGSSVTLTVSGVSGSSISGWSPATCSGSSCQVVMNGAQQVTYTATTNNLVFSTSSTYNGSLGGRSEANVDCNSAASQAGLPGHYVAWLATTTANATSALGSARGWIRPDGRPFADTIGVDGGTTGMINGQVYYPPSVDELGQQVDAYTVTGTDLYGSAGATCADFTSTSGSLSIGFTYAGNYSWSAAAETSCNAQGALVCFGIDLSAPIALNLQSGRRAFVTTGTLATPTSLSAADQLCVSEATGAGLSNAANFQAMLAGVGIAAGSRFDSAGANWVRLDGVPIGSSASALLAGQITAPVAMHANGTYVVTIGGYPVWTGASDPSTAGASATTCNDWMSSTGTVEIGDGTTTATWFGSQPLSYDCDSLPFAVYCFEK